MRKSWIGFFILAALTPALVLAAGKSLTPQSLTLELITGSAYNVTTPLTIHQTGYPDLNINANYDTNPFGDEAPYYSWRIGLWNGDQGWEIQQIHHKLYLLNPPPEVQHFEITHGFNYFFLGHAWKKSGLIFHAGIGPIITHPEAIIRNLQVDSDHGGFLNGGYYFSGIGVQGAVGKDFYFTKSAFVMLEVATTVGWAWWTPTPGGSSDVTNLALHGHFGIGYDF